MARESDNKKRMVNVEEPNKTSNESILDLVLSECVFSVKKTGGTFWITEECDGNFAVELTKEQLIQLDEELIELANKAD